jgi:hypothetical protein
LLDPPTIEESAMPAEKPKAPKTVSIKMPADVVESARVVSALRGVSMTDMLGDYLRPLLSQWEDEEIRKRAAGKRKGAGK